MKKLLILCLLFLHSAYGQDNETVTLENCVKWAKQNYPLARQNGLLSEYSATNVSAYNENWYPKLSFLLKGTYQTEVVQFDFPGISTRFPHDSYVANVSLDQTLFDGGQTKKQKQVETLSEQVELQKNEVELYKLVDRVSQLYVGILLSQENIAIQNTYRDNLLSRRKDVENSVKNGLALESNLDEVDAEILKTDQGIIEAKESLSSGLRSLSLYTGKKLGENTKFSTEALGGDTASEEVKRPEMRLFTLQEEVLQTRYELTNRMALPKVSFFAGANYGRPGPNFINQNLRFFGDAGLTVRWNISSLYGLNREEDRFDINKRMIDVQREVFLFNITNTLEAQSGQISSIREMISRDTEIVQKRHNVTVTATSQLENGKITFTDYLLQLNAEMQASMNQKLHEIRLMGAMSNYNTTRGINNF